jgi:antitoxin MazE
MKAAIIRIGNSRGVRIPKLLLAECELQGEIEMEVRGRDLVIRSCHAPRAGWEAKFRQMAASRDDNLIDRVAGPSTEWAGSEWEW